MRPKLELLEVKLVDDIIIEAMEVLSRIGVFIEDGSITELLQSNGARVESGAGRVMIPEDLVQRCLDTVPHAIRLFDAGGTKRLELENDRVHFDPGSAALWILDPSTGRERKPGTKDLIDLALVVNSCSHLAAQSTSLIPDDVPGDVSDRYRLFIALLFCPKPIVTGTFALDAFPSMREMLTVVAGGEKRLAEKPLAIFDACPSPPLMWSTLTSKVLVDCAKSGIPAELVSMPLTGATAPVTLAGALVQHTAENLSGIVIHQLAKPGSPIIYGGSPSAFDMRKGTTPMGAIETMMLDVAYSQIGKHLGLPTHAYMGLSDTKAIDSQAGFESGAGILLGALAGVNVISGPGMLDFESCFSLEKMLLDNEICGMAFRLVGGVEPRGERMGFEVLSEAIGSGKPGEYFLTCPDTLRWFRKEFAFPSALVDRSAYGEWLEGGAKDAFARAREKVAEITAAKPEPVLGPRVQKELRRIMERDLSRAGVKGLPESVLQFIS
jgi:trimethylamine--corrinoid protein Co-methyltransferase